MDEGQYAVEGNTIVYDDYALTFSATDGEVTITGIIQNIEGDTINVVIPESIEVGEETLPVTTIGDRAFYHCTALTEIDCSSVTAIGDCAFEYCDSLTTVDCSSVTSIGNSAFYHCNALEKIDCSSVETIGQEAFVYCSFLTTIDCSNATEIGRRAFYHCNALTEIDCSSVTTIGDETFCDCYALTEIDCSNVTSIGDYAFEDCATLTTIDCSSVTAIGSNAFEYCPKLESITCPSVTTIGDETFRNCYALPEIDCSSVTEIGYGAFYNCQKLESIDCPNVTEIGNNAFYGCTSLTDFNFSNITSIGKQAFAGCSSLGDTITLPSTLTSIGTDAFKDCTSLTDIYYEGSTEDWAAIIGEYTLGENITVHFIVVEDNYTYCETCHEIYYDDYTLTYEISNGEVTITGYTGTPVDVVIPAAIGDVPITTIGEWAFGCCTSLTEIDCSSVTEIGDYAFEGCQFLTEIDCSSVTTIGYGAFAYCDALIEIDCSSVETIGDYAFYDCTALTTVTFGSSLETIGDWAFDYCSSLESFEVDENNPNFCSEDGVLFNKDKKELIRYPSAKGTSYTVPDTVTTIADDAFCSSSLESITLSSSVTTIGNSAFYDCTSLSDVYFYGTEDEWNDINIGSNNTNLTSATIHYLTVEDDYTYCETCHEIYYDGYTLKYEINDEEVTITGYSGTPVEVVIPESLGGTPITTIGEKAFYQCTSLEKIDCSSVTEIGDYAFYNCTSLATIDCSSVETIGDYAFYNCTSLTTIDCPNVTSIGKGEFCGCTSLKSIKVNNKYFCNEDGVLFNKDKTELICYPAGKKETSYTVPESVETIDDYAFEYCTSLDTIDCSSVTTIGQEAFWNCTSLTTVDCSSVTEIGDRAFAYCTSLTTITFGSSLETIGEYAFAYCDSLTTIDCSSVTTIGRCAFYKCTSLTTIDCSSVTAIGDCAFEYCDSLTTVDCPNVTTIGEWAFYNCTSLTTIDCSSVTKIGSYAFERCTSLTTIDCSSVTTIGDFAFEGCTFLATITFGSSLEAIGNFAFYNCTALSDVYFYGTETEWRGISVGNYNTNLTNAKIHYLTIEDDYTYCKTCHEIYYDGYTLTYEISDEEVTITGYTGTPVEVVIPEEIEGLPVTTIGDYAFQGCKSLTTVTFGSSLETIGEWAFDYCSSLESFEVDENNPNFCSEDGMLFNKDKTELIRYPSAKGTSYTVPDTVTKIAADAFCSSSLESITLSSSVMAIGNNAFELCTALTEIYCPNVTTIGDYAFQNCSSLGDAITLPSTLTSIGTDAFKDCTSLSLVFYDGTEDDWESISGYSALSSATIRYLQGENIADNLTFTYNGREEFLASGDTADLTITITGCTDSTKFLTIPDTIDGVAVTDIGERAFMENTDLIQVTLGENITTVGAYAFYCSKLIEINFSSSLESIGKHAFDGCESLDDATYDGTAEEWAEKVTVGTNNEILDNVITFLVESEPATEPTPIVWELAKATATAGDEVDYDIIISGAIESNGLQGAIYFPDETFALLDTDAVEFIASEDVVSAWHGNSLYFALEGTIEGNDGTLATLAFTVPDEETVLAVANAYGLTLHYTIDKAYYEFPIEWLDIDDDDVFAYLDSDDVDRMSEVELTNGYLRIYVDIDNAENYTTTETTTTTEETTESASIVLPDEAEFAVGDSFTLTLDAEDVTWFTNDSTVATVSQDGVVTIVGAGTVTIMAIDGNGNSYSITFETVDVETTTTEATTTTVELTSSDEDVTETEATTTTVEETTTTEEATTTTVESTTEEITTEATTVPSVAFEDSSSVDLTVGSSFTLTLDVEDVTWFTSDSSVLTVTQDGVVTVVGEGTATIMVVDGNGNIYQITLETVAAEETTTTTESTTTTAMDTTTVTETETTTTTSTTEPETTTTTEETTTTTELTTESTTEATTESTTTTTESTTTTTEETTTTTESTTTTTESTTEATTMMTTVTTQSTTETPTEPSEDLPQTGYSHGYTAAGVAACGLVIIGGICLAMTRKKK